MVSTFILGAICGLLIGLAICYGKQIYGVYQNRDKISAISDLGSSIQHTADVFGLKI